MLRFLLYILPSSHMQHLLLSQRMHLLWNRAQKQKTATDLTSVAQINGKSKTFSVSLKQVTIWSQNQWSILGVSFSRNLKIPRSWSYFSCSCGLAQSLSSSVWDLFPGCDPHFPFPIIPCHLCHMWKDGQGLRWTLLSSCASAVSFGLRWFSGLPPFFTFSFLDLFSLLLPLDFQGTLML